MFKEYEAPRIKVIKMKSNLGIQLEKVQWSRVGLIVSSVAAGIFWAISGYQGWNAIPANHSWLSVSTHSNEILKATSDAAYYNMWAAGFSAMAAVFAAYREYRYEK